MRQTMRREWVGLVLGAWILVSPWIFSVAAIGFMKWSNVLVGLVLIVMNAWRIFGKEI